MHKKSGLTVSGIVENYLQNLIKLERQKAETDYKLPGELDSLNTFVTHITVMYISINESFNILKNFFLLIISLHPVNKSSTVIIGYSGRFWFLVR